MVLGSHRPTLLLSRNFGKEQIDARKCLVGGSLSNEYLGSWPLPEKDTFNTFSPKLWLTHIGL